MLQLIYITFLSYFVKGDTITNSTTNTTEMINISPTWMPSHMYLTDVYNQSTHEPSNYFNNQSVQESSTEVPILYAPSKPTPAPTNTPYNASQSFIQSYCGSSELSFMTPDQISSYMIVLELVTSQYAIGEPLVHTATQFFSQNLYIIDTEEDITSSRTNPCLSYNNIILIDKSLTFFSLAPSLSPTISMSNTNITSILPTGPIAKELRIRYNMTWSSSIIPINRSEYVYNFTIYMNLPETKAKTVDTLNQLGVRAQYASNVRISVAKPTEAPTEAPTTLQPTYNTKTLDRTSIILVCFCIGIGIAMIIGLYIMCVPQHFWRGLLKKFYKSDNVSDNDTSQEHKLEFLKSDTSIVIPITNTNRQEHKLEFLKSDTSIVIPITNTNPNNTLSTINTNPDNTISSLTIADNNYSILKENNVVKDSYFYDANENSINKKSIKSSASSFFINSDGDELNLYKNKTLEKFKHKLRTYLIFDGQDGDDSVSYTITNVLLMNENDCIEILSTIGCFIDYNGNVSINEFEIEANMLFKSYDWLKRNDLKEKKRKEYVIEHILQPIIICILYKILSINASIRILYECCSILLQKDLLKNNATTNYGKSLSQNNNKTILITGMRKNVNIHNVISTFQNFGDNDEMDYIALASLSRDFGFVRYTNETICKVILQKFRTSEIVVQDVAVVIKLLSSYYSVDSAPTKFKNVIIPRPSQVSRNNDTIMHILSENCSSSMRSLVKMTRVRNVSGSSTNSNASCNSSLFRRSTSWPNNLDSMVDNDDYLLEDNQNDDEDQHVHLMRQWSILNPYI